MNMIIDTLKQDQSSDGSWAYPFETGIATDCYMIILLRSLQIDDENLIKELLERIFNKQEKTGEWELFHDEEEGNLSATLEAYYAILYSGYYKQTDRRLTLARKYILRKGGIQKAHMFTKIMLAITGQYKWPSFLPIPLEFILLPTTFPINLFHFSEYGRANMIPIMLLADQKFSLKTEKSPDLSDLYVRGEEEKDQLSFYSDLEEWRSLHTFLQGGINQLFGLPSQLRSLAKEQAKLYMLNRLEPDGTFLGYFSSTFLMIFAILSSGHRNHDPIILNAVNGLKSMKCKIDGFSHVQYTTATVWNTSLINYALQEAGLNSHNHMVQQANQYLLSRQHHKFGDWLIHNPTGLPGGWGFSDVNTIHPDIDDTTASLRSLARLIEKEPVYQASWARGIHWLLSMQNRDGGWPAFEKNTNNRLLKFLPIEKGEFILTDPTSADLTGRTLEFLGSYTNLGKQHEAIRAAVHWLHKNQEKNGSWYGRWGICYIYGTWAAITGLRAVGILSSDTAIQKGVDWLINIQNEDGGWGESCKSDLENTYVPLEESTLTHTAWAVDALISVYSKPTKAIGKGIQFLLRNLEREDWTTQYPKGQGMAGGFYIHYHSYRYIFPLLALAHFQQKYGSGGPHLDK
jgi:sporulenol synthase